ncbi:LamG domain-containing protein, partial [Paenibacillus elgii]
MYFNVFLIIFVLPLEKAAASSASYSESSYNYDSSGRLINVQLPTGQGKEYIYDANGNITRNFASLSFDGTKQISLNNIAVNTKPGGKNTVEFWMYWTGAEGVMPFSWDGPYDLWFSEGYFGFNTGESNILGISSADLKNRWVHVAATFYNGVPDAVNNELYINGVKQNLAPVLGKTTSSVTVTSNAVVSGVLNNHMYRFIGKIGTMRIWNHALSATEIQANMYKLYKGMEAGLVGDWKLGEIPSQNSSLAFEGTKQVSLNNIAVNTAPGAKNTVEFWMYWDG